MVFFKIFEIMSLKNDNKVLWLRTSLFSYIPEEMCSQYFKLFHH
jgi:hypothetical protein